MLTLLLLFCYSKLALFIAGNQCTLDRIAAYVRRLPPPGIALQYVAPFPTLNFQATNIANLNRCHPGA